MNCPYCNHNDSKVIDSRDANDGIRRRRQCLACGSRFTTYERLQPASLFVIKKDQRREEFNPEKIIAGLRMACGKRPLPAAAVDRIAEDVEAEIYRMGGKEISSAAIGEMVMAKLKRLDHIAYLRYASVYREFEDITALKEEIDTLSGAVTIQPADQLRLIPEDEPGGLPWHRRERP